MNDMSELIERARIAIQKKATGANVHTLYNSIAAAKTLNYAMSKTGKDNTQAISNILTEVYKKIGT